MIHLAVLQKEVLKYLAPKQNENFIDCTVGQGGHALGILERNGPAGKVLGIDEDSFQIKNCEANTVAFKDRLILANDSYTNLKKIIGEYKFEPVSGILFDLGMSSWHLEKSGRGFSFLRDEPLDMRYRVTSFYRSTKRYYQPAKRYYQLTAYRSAANLKEYQLTAAEIVSSWPESEIERILKEYGQERFARRIAKEIVREREVKPIKTTSQLLAIIKKAIPAKHRHKKIHFATRTFQALRISVNDELNNLKKALPQAIDVLSPGGRIVAISFHSLEDRIVKNFFRDLSPEKLKILTKKPITPSGEEIEINPRSRSAKLRAAIKI